MKTFQGLLTAFSLLIASGASSQTIVPYFQQRVDTKLEVTLDDRTHFLRGRESFIYTNNSRDTLRELYLHLYPNAYSSDRTAFSRQQVLQGKTSFYFSKPAQRGYIDSLDFIVDGMEAAYVSSEMAPDIARLELPEPLAPGKTVTVETPFRVKIPAVWSRMGHTRQAYYISQWFPKPAVYDRKGWHPMPYLDQGEFYSEIGKYEVSITLPKNYVVLATGNCLTESENDFMDSLARVPLPEVVEKPNQGPLPSVVRTLDSIPPSSSEWKTIRFEEDDIHDFAFFADKRYVLQKDTVRISGGAGTVTVWSGFLPLDSRSWKKSNSFLKKTVAYLGEHVGPYPYKTIKMAEGDLKAGGGMEYPTVALIDRAASSSEGLLRTTVVHEAGHNWFQGILATNERDHPWMDEGVNSFYERKIIASLTGRPNSDDNGYRSQDDLYYQQVRNGLDQPMETTSAELTEINYPVDAYIKPALFLGWLESNLGDSLFEVSMKRYYAAWHHRHPYPEDMSSEFVSVFPGSSWFFNTAIQSDQPVDYRANRHKWIVYGKKDWRKVPAAIHTETHKEEADVTINDQGSVARPLRDRNDDSTYHDQDRVYVDPAVPDATPANNGNGGLALRFGFGTTRSEKQRIFLLPALGYNAYDGFMAGGLIHNLGFPESKFRYLLAPLYGFGSKDLVGAGSIGLFLHPRGGIQELAIQLDGKSFHDYKTDFNTPVTLRTRYAKLAPSLTFTFRKPYPNHPATRTLLVKGYAIHEEGFTYTTDGSGTTRTTLYPGDWRGYGLLRYSHRNERTFNPFSYTAEVQGGQSFLKLSLEGKIRIDYNVKNKGLHLRGFLGKFIVLDESDALLPRYYLNTTVTGPYDYLYDDTYPGRNERDGLGAQQISMREGGFRLPTPYYASPLGRSDNFLAALNIKTDLPLGKLPLRVFLDVATFSGAKRLNPSGSGVLYEAGIELYAADFLTVSLPLILSSDYSDYLKSVYGKDAFSRRITFSLAFDRINWLRTVSGGLKKVM